MGNVEVGRIVGMPQGQGQRLTLNVLYRLTTEMGERNVVLAHLPTPYQLTTEMGERQGWAQQAIKCTLQADHRNGGMSRLGPEGY